MAVPIADTAGTTVTFQNQQTMVEDVVDKLYDLSPTSTPFASAIGSNAATNVLHQWIEDALSPAGSQAIVQGSDAADQAAEVGERKTNYTQIFRGVVTVSETMDAVSQYGISKMASYLAAKKSKEVKRDIEFTFLNAQTGAAGGDSTATLMNAAQSYIDSSQVTAVDGPLVESDILDTMEVIYTNGGSPTMLLCAPSQANAIAAFATATASGITRQMVNEISTLTSVVDVIRTPFGTLTVSLDRFQRASDLWLLDTEYWAKSILRPSSLQPLAKTGSATKLMIETELTLQGSASKSSGLLTGLT